MKLSNVLAVSVPERKITGYLLSSIHRTGRGKAQFFLAHGYRVDQWEILAKALHMHAQAHDVIETEKTSFGMRYVIEGNLEAPDGAILFVRTVWFIENNATLPRFVTAYPGKRRRL